MKSKIAQLTRRLGRGLGKLGADERGGILMIFALGTPAVALLVAGAVDLFSVSTDKDAAQAAVDAAALNIASQINMSTAAGLQGRAQQLVDAQLEPLTGRMSYTVTATADNQAKNLTVELSGQRQSFFMNLLPPGGWNIRVKAIAQSMGQVPLCILSAGSSGLDRVSMIGGAKLTANGCLVQSNSEILVAPGASLAAATVQSVGVATGAISPSPQVGAASIADPFASMTIAPPGACTAVDQDFQNGVITLPAGIHCGNITVEKTGSLQLGPGDHYFLKGKLELKDSASLTGTDVVMIFDSKSNLKFGDQSVIQLNGRKTGPYAGFVIATTNANTGVFEISSDHARELLGTIYVPSAQLLVTGTGNNIADQAAWTVIVAKSIAMSGSPNLVINSNYAGTSVPVPQGVGPSTIKGVKLTK